MTVRKLLMPHDGSHLSGAIVDALAPLLQADTQITLLHVEDAGHSVEDALSDTERKLSSHGALVTRKVISSGDPAGAILDAALESRPDLVVMSTHGRSGIERWVRGSVAERVLRSCPVPLFMINPLTHAGSSFSSILVPLDTSSNAEQILDSIIPFASLFNARLTLLFVDWNDPTDDAENTARRRASRAQDVAEWFAGPRQRIEAAGLTAEIRIAHGDPASQIVKAAQPGEFDLLAMSTHGRTGPGRWLLGSIAEKVLGQCRIPLLLRPTAKG